MNRNFPALLAIALFSSVIAAGQTITDPAHIEVYVTPYYNSKGPASDVGPLLRVKPEMFRFAQHEMVV